MNWVQVAAAAPTVALVTGAASGIGAAVAAERARTGATVALADIDGDGLAEQVRTLERAGLRAHAYPVDLADPSAVEAMVSTVENTLGRVDQLVNAAGVLRLAPARAISDADWAATFAVNASGVFHTSRSVVARMVERRRGAIVTIVSNAATTPRIGMAAYAASKAAAAMFTKCLGLEVAEFGIRCNLVAPGSTDTAMLRSMWRDDADRATTLAGNLETFRVGIPLRNLAMPADIAGAVAYLLSAQAAHITMHTLTVDGGASLGG